MHPIGFIPWGGVAAHLSHNETPIPHAYSKLISDPSLAPASPPGTPEEKKAGNSNSSIFLNFYENLELDYLKSSPSPLNSEGSENRGSEGSENKDNVLENGGKNGNGKAFCFLPLPVNTGTNNPNNP